MNGCPTFPHPSVQKVASSPSSDSASCRCGLQLDMFGHHRAVCAEAGVLGRRGYPLEVAAVVICREAGVRVSTNVYARDLDLAAFNVLDGGRLEVVADELT